MTITDIEMYRDGGTITFRVVDGPFAGDYRLQTPFRGQPCPLFRDEVRIPMASREERRLLDALRQWFDGLPTDIRAGVEELDRVSWVGLSKRLYEFVPQYLVRSVIRCLEERHFPPPGRERSPQLGGKSEAPAVNGLEPALPGSIPVPKTTVFTYQEIRRFIDEYLPADETLIAYEERGRSCANYEFRKEVLSVALADLHAVPMNLVRDLYRAETEFSRVVHGIDMRAVQLAEHLLWHGGDEYILDYINGKGKSFDASLLMGGVRMTADHARHLLDWTQRRLQSESAADEWSASLLRDAEELFTSWVGVLNGFERS